MRSFCSSSCLLLCLGASFGAQGLSRPKMVAQRTIVAALSIPERTDCRKNAVVFGIPRGGGAFRWGSLRLFKSSSSSDLYRNMLTEQRDLLDRQLRQTREELAQLRTKYRTLQVAKISVDGKSGGLLKALKEQLAELEQKAKKVAEMKEDLERMLKEEQEKVVLLQVKVAELSKAAGDLKERYAEELDKLRRKMEEQATKQLEELRVMMETRMKEALDKSKRAAEKEREEAIKETERRVQQKADKQLQSERKKAEEAVEREKVKMRKLIKALAEREKKLVSQAERDKAKTTRQNKSSSSTKQTVSPSTSTSQQTTPGTVRGPLK